MASADYGAGVGPDDEPPFESAWSRKVFDRATLLARGLFPCAESVVALVKDGQVWRSRERYRHLGVDRAGERVVASGELLWIEDGRCDPRFADDPLVTGEPHLRGYVGAPIKLADGSVQGLAELPEPLKAIYRTAWEMPMRSLIDLAAERGPYVDQSQSLNLFMATPNLGPLSAMYMYAWKRGLKTTYYLRSRPATRIAKTTVAQAGTAAATPVEHPAVSAADAVACSLENPDTCEACQ